MISYLDYTGSYAPEYYGGPPMPAILFVPAGKTTVGRRYKLVWTTPAPDVSLHRSLIVCQLEFGVGEFPTAVEFEEADGTRIPHMERARNAERRWLKVLLQPHHVQSSPAAIYLHAIQDEVT